MANSKAPAAYGFAVSATKRPSRCGSMIVAGYNSILSALACRLNGLRMLGGVEYHRQQMGIIQVLVSQILAYTNVNQTGFFGHFGCKGEDDGRSI